MKLYSQYKLAIEKIGKINKAYFTTFNLSPEFFETYILPPLLCEDIPDNDFSLENLNTSLEESRTDIKVFYDAHMLALNEKKRTLTKFYPILMNNGLFHPKVIWLESDNKSILFIGSGNLTISGWGRNIEAFKIIELDNGDNLYEQVQNFFVDVKIYAGLRKNKTYKKIEQSNGINFVYSFEKSNANFLNSLELDRNLHVWSPYFSNDLDKLLEEESLKSLEIINIVPDLVGNEKMRISFIPSSRKVRYFNNDKPDDVKMNHSKVWISDSKMAIGSYNFTREALFGTNFEAAIVENIKNIDLEFLKESKPICMNDNELKDESLEIDNRYEVVFKIEASWKKQTISIEEISNKKLPNLKVILPANIEVSMDNNEELKIDIAKKEKVFRALIKNKLYTIKQEDKIIFEGLLLEVDTKDYREPMKVETLDDIFTSFMDTKYPTSARKLKNETRNFDKNDEASINLQHTDSNYLNYYNLFRGFFNMQNHLKSVTEEKQLRQFCFTSSNSLTSISSVIAKSECVDLFTYLFIDELNDLIQLANKKLENFEFDNIEYVDNIDIKLEKQDLEFIKGFKL